MNNPYHSPQTDPPPPGNLRSVLIRVVLLSGIGLVVLLLLIPARRGDNLRSSRRIACRDNLRQIGLAIANYSDAYGEPPPLMTTDEQGTPLHSWRTLILEFTEGHPQDVYRQIDLSKPWDHPQNLQAGLQMPEFYECRSALTEQGLTVYQAATEHKGRLTWLKTPYVLMVGETADQLAVPWMQPADNREWFRTHPDSRTGTHHMGGLQILTSEGDVRFVSQQVDPEIRKMLLNGMAREVEY